VIYTPGHLRRRPTAALSFACKTSQRRFTNRRCLGSWGYVPAKNIGTTVKAKIITLLQTRDVEFLEPFVATADPVRLAKYVTAVRQQAVATRPLGSFQPDMVSTIATSYVRDPALKV